MTRLLAPRSFVQNTPVDGMDTLSANISGTVSDRLFVTILVTEN